VAGPGASAPSDPVVLGTPLDTGSGAALNEFGPWAPLVAPVRQDRAGGARTADRSGRQATALRLVTLDLVGALLAMGVGLLAVMAAFAVFSPRNAWALLAVPILLLSFWLHGLYGGNTLRLVPAGLPVAGRTARSLPVAALCVTGILLATGAARGVVALGAAVLLVLPAVATVPLLRSCARRFGRAAGLGRAQRVLIIGSGEAAEGVASRLQRHGGITVVGMVDDDPLPGYDTIGRVAQVPDLCGDLAVDRIVVALPRAPWFVVSEVLQPLIGQVDIAVVPSLHELVTWRSGTQDLAGMALIPLAAAQHSRIARPAKRGLDIVGAGLGLLVLSPLLVGAALAIRLDSKGPVLFRQQRAGQGRAPFTILKLRTMRVGAEAERAQLFDQRDADGPRFKMNQDPRITRVGTFLRRYSIDELPQLVNVLKGEMSLVGPRPYPLMEAEALQVGAAASRFEVPPGMTGLWQVSGRSDLTWDDLCRLDAIYVRSWSLTWDLRILLQTPTAAVGGQGAY